MLGNVAAYHRWRGGLPGDVLRLASMLFIFVGAILLTAHMGFTGQWGWFWYSVIVLTAITIGGVVWELTRSNGGSSAEGGSRAKPE